jgi:hypothetical protein
MLSGYDNTLYSDMLSSWVKIEKTVRADKAILRTECLWLNQPAHEKLRQVRLDAPNGAAT